jgi:hypothetical protein
MYREVEQLIQILADRRMRPILDHLEAGAGHPRQDNPLEPPKRLRLHHAGIADGPGDS